MQKKFHVSTAKTTLSIFMRALLFPRTYHEVHTVLST